MASFGILILCLMGVLVKCGDVENEMITEATETSKKMLYSPEDLLTRILLLADQAEGRQNNVYSLPQFPGYPNQNYYSPLQNPNNMVPPLKKRRKRRRKQKQGQYQLHQRPQSDPGVLENLTKALQSIAMYDDYQCVPRLLCEATAGGITSNSNGQQESSFLPSFMNMQPLVDLLSAAGGMSSSPLFIFGRAALLGITSQGKSASCSYAYPSCPRDPERLVQYLNNHKGGFFRFFGGVNPQQNYPGGANGAQLQQFYNLIAQNLQNQGIQSGGAGPFNQKYGKPYKDLYRPGKKRRRRPSKVVFPKYKENDDLIVDSSKLLAEDEDLGYGIENRILNGDGLTSNYHLYSQINVDNTIYAEENGDETPENAFFKFPEESVRGPEVASGTGKRGKSLKFPENLEENYPTAKPFFPKADVYQYGGASTGNAADFVFFRDADGESVRIKGGRFYRDSMLNLGDSVKDFVRKERDGKSFWVFPSTYQGVIYND